MTIEKANEWFKKVIDVYEIYPIENDVKLEVFKIATKALEKEIPKKPTYVDTRFRHHGRNIADGSSLCKCYKCPNCSAHIFHVFDSETHCNHCGQALNWDALVI